MTLQDTRLALGLHDGDGMFEEAPVTRGSPFIAGIYNYCDGWCERCAFTARCLVYHQAATSRTRCSRKARHPVPLVKYLHKRFRRTWQLLSGTGRPHRTGSPAFKSADARPPRGPTDADRTTVGARYEPLVLAGHVYAAMVDSWIEDEAPWLKKIGAATGPPLAPPNYSAVTAALRDMHNELETILWDRTLIPVKLARAMSNAPADDASASDREGSAKVALLSMDRSRRCWAALRSRRRGRDASILPVIAHLDALRKLTEARFPVARRFRRPGFDDAGAAAGHGAFGSGRGLPGA